jgi:hypothetical protein
MTILQHGSRSRREAVAVLEWRFSQLRRSGYGIDDAVVLAAARDVDLHCAAELIARGCPPRLARRILV